MSSTIDYKDTKEYKEYAARQKHAQLTDRELANLKTYGVLSPQEFAPDDEPELQEGQCVCGAFDCKESYSCYTSGY